MTMAWIISGDNLLKADKPAVIPGIWNPFDFCGCVDTHLFYLIILFKSVWHENVSAFCAHADGGSGTGSGCMGIYPLLM